MPTVLLAGGGSTGHISPLLAIADELAHRDPDTRILVLGTQDGLESRLVPEAGYTLLTIEKVPAPRRINAGLLTFPAKLGRTITGVRAILRENHVDVVVGVGGYVSTPAYLAAKSLGIPIVIHEANARPGLANRLGARLTSASRIGYTFSSTPLPGTQVGMPMRRAINPQLRTSADQRVAAARRLGVDPSRPLLLVTGGSLGAQALNEAVSQSRAQITGTGAQVLHITGGGKAEDVVAAVTGDTDYHVVEYLPSLADAYTAADLVVCRSGAGTVAELTAMALPAIYVPLPVGNGEQRLNAQDSVAAGAALLVDNADFTTQYVTDTLIPLLSDAERLRAMETAARELNFPTRADAAMADMVLAATASGRTESTAQKEDDK